MKFITGIFVFVFVVATIVGTIYGLLSTIGFLKTQVQNLWRDYVVKYPGDVVILNRLAQSSYNENYDDLRWDDQCDLDRVIEREYGHRWWYADSDACLWFQGGEVLLAAAVVVGGVIVSGVWGMFIMDVANK